MAQLTNQDPLNPTEDKEFVAQLAQFTSLEQLQDINAGVETLNTTMTQSHLMTATGFIGKDVVTNGNQVTKFNVAGQVYTSRAWFTVDQDIAKAQATVFDGNGNIIYQEDLGARNAGSYAFDWNGRNIVGQEVPQGVYQVVVSAQDKNDSAVLVKQQITARVVGVMNEDGTYKLILDGGRVVPITDVTEVTNATDSAGDVTTYSGQAADAAAAATIAERDAQLYWEKTEGSEPAADGKKWAESAIKAAETARDAATKARSIADKALAEAESLKTAEALDEYNKANDHATKAGAMADQAGEHAEAAKKWAEDKWNVEFA